MNKRLTILINSPDSYSDVLTVFIKCFDINWSECTYEKVLSTNTQSPDGFTVLKSGG